MQARLTALAAPCYWIHSGYCVTLQLLLILPFVPDFQGNCDVDASSFDGNTALHLAAGYGLKGQTALLVAAGADTSLQNSDEETAFDLANVAEVSICCHFEERKKRNHQ